MNRPTVHITIYKQIICSINIKKFHEKFSITKRIMKTFRQATKIHMRPIKVHGNIQEQ